MCVFGDTNIARDYGKSERRRGKYRRLTSIDKAEEGGKRLKEDTFSPCEGGVGLADFLGHASPSGFGTKIGSDKPHAAD